MSYAELDASELLKALHFVLGGVAFTAVHRLRWHAVAMCGSVQRVDNVVSVEVKTDDRNS